MALRLESVRLLLRLVLLSSWTPAAPDLLISRMAEMYPLFSTGLWLEFCLFLGIYIT